MSLKKRRGAGLSWSFDGPLPTFFSSSFCSTLIEVVKLTRSGAVAQQTRSPQAFVEKWK